MKQNNFMVDILLDDKEDEERIMYYIYQTIQEKLNDYNIDYMNLLVTNNKTVYEESDSVN